MYTLAKKERRKQRLLKEIKILEGMNNKLWLQMCAGAFLLFTLFCLAIYSFHTRNTLLGEKYLLSIVVFSIVIALIGVKLKTNLYQFWIIPFLGFILLISLIFESDLFDLAKFGDHSSKEKYTPRHSLTREECVDRAISKRKMLLAKLENID